MSDVLSGRSHGKVLTIGVREINPHSQIEVEASRGKVEKDVVLFQRTDDVEHTRTPSLLVRRVTQLQQ